MREQLKGKVQKKQFLLGDTLKKKKLAKEMQVAH